MITQEKKAKILLLDIENTALISHTWGRYDQNVVHVEQESYILSFSYKWLGDKKAYVIALNDMPGYKPNTNNDEKLVRKIHEIMSQADILCGQNSDKFDIKKLNTRFIYYNLQPLPPQKTTDTLKIAKRKFAFSSNKLDDLGKFLGLGEKIKTGGYDLWLGCMQGNKSAWQRMKAYNLQDILLLEKVYLKLRSWDNLHPNVGMYHEGICCPKCSSIRFQYRGYAVNSTTKYKRAQCQDCSGWFRVGKNLQVIKPGVNA